MLLDCGILVPESSSPIHIAQPTFSGWTFEAMFRKDDDSGRIYVWIKGVCFGGIRFLWSELRRNNTNNKISYDKLLPVPFLPPDEVVDNYMEQLLPYHEFTDIFFQLHDSVKTYDMSLKAVKIHNDYLYGVPLEHRDARLCITALVNVSYGEEPGALLEHVPASTRTTKFYRAILSQRGELLPYIYDDLEPDMYKLAMESSWRSVPQQPLLSAVPLNHRTLNLCMIAFARDKRNFRFFPPSLKTAKLCEIIMAWYPSDLYVFRFIPESARTPRLFALIKNTSRHSQPMYREETAYMI